MQLTETTEVECPKCGDSVSAPVPSEEVELIPRPYRGAFGDYTELECSEDHTIWVYVC